MSENPINIIGEIRKVIEKFNTKRLENYGSSSIHKDITYSDKEDIWSIKKPFVIINPDNNKEEQKTGFIKININGEENYSEGSVVEIFRRIKTNNEIDFFVRPYLFSNSEVTIEDLPNLKEVFFWETERKRKKATVKVEESYSVLSHSPSTS